LAGRDDHIRHIPMTAGTAAQLEANVKAARETLAAYDHKLNHISSAIFDHVSDDGFWDTTPKIDFRPMMKAYAQSKELDPMLLESEWLYKAMVPRMVRNIMESMCEDNDTPLLLRIDPDDQVAMAHDDVKWVETIRACHGYKFQTYKYADFVQVAQGKEVQVAGDDSDKETPDVRQRRADMAARGRQHGFQIERMLDHERRQLEGEYSYGDDSD
jgi:hypothetical protein